jgi:F420-dependent methylenetetrahydromethanopterin dehydrogenase
MRPRRRELRAALASRVMGTSGKPEYKVLRKCSHCESAEAGRNDLLSTAAPEAGSPAPEQAAEKTLTTINERLEAQIDELQDVR